ncbi:MAG TPA: hypothetical protein VIH99_02125 [Bdellovibrionota bacterium]
MRTLALILLSCFASPAALAVSKGAEDSCRRICSGDSECAGKCTSHVDLFELQTDFLSSVAAWNVSTDDRMKAVRSGANREVLDLCRSTGWSLDNIFTCLRSYPTPDVIQSCKKLSPRQEEQVRCVRAGKSSAEVDACASAFPGSDMSLHCLEMQVTAQETRWCRERKGGSAERMSCLEDHVAIRQRDTREFEEEIRRAAAREEAENSRKPASEKRK